MIRFSSAIRRYLPLSLLLLSTMLPLVAQGQGSGIPSEGREFWLGYVRGTDRTYFGSFRGIFAHIASYSDNVVSVTYFDENGNEVSGPQYTIGKYRSIQIPLDRSRMRGSLLGESIEYRAARLTSKQPIAVSFYSEGSFNGALYQSFPMSAWGKKYVIASHNDAPAANGTWSGDSASSTFLIIAAFNNTSVTITPNATTMSGRPGVNTGVGATGVPKPFTITLQRGQTYQVMSRPNDRDHDMSGSTVESSKPVAVIAGHQRALVGDPGGAVAALDADYRDMILEQMIPVESWESEGYIAIPFYDPPYVSSMYPEGKGDLFRMYSYKTTEQAQLYQGGIRDPYTYQLGPFATAERDNVQDAVNIGSVSGNRISVAMYDHFQGELHGSWATGYTSPGMVNVIPRKKWKRNFIWHVPNESRYKGAQFINVIAPADQIDKIKLILNAGQPKPLLSLPKLKTFTIPQAPELRGVQLRVTPGTYIAQSEQPFIVYHYAYEDRGYKDNFGYASTVGQLFGNLDDPYKPRIEVTPDCSSWGIRVFDSRSEDQGIAEILLLNDPEGFISWPPRVSYNVRLVPTQPQFAPGDTSVSFVVAVNNPLENAFAAIYVVDKAGNDTVLTLNYTAPKISLSPQFADYGKVLVQDEVCKTYVLKNTSEAGGEKITVSDDTRWVQGDEGFSIRSITPALQFDLTAGDSVIIQICFTVRDTGMVHADTLFVKTGCFEVPIAVVGSGVTPIVHATDVDFGSVKVGEKRCREVTVTNEGTAPLTLTKDYLLRDTREFSFADESVLPVVLQPGQSIKLEFCYQPLEVGFDTTRTDWGTDLREPFLGQRKDYSILNGRAVNPGLVWDRNRQAFDVECDDPKIDTFYLINNSDRITGQPITVLRVTIEGPDKDEWKLIENSLGYFPLEGFPLGPEDSIRVVYEFSPNLSKGYRPRSAFLKAIGQGMPDSLNPVVDLTANISHAELALNVTSHDFGIREVGEKDSLYVQVSNAGDAPLVISSLTLAGGAFVIDSGLAVGDVIAPGGMRIVKVLATVLADAVFTDTLRVDGRTNCESEQRVSMRIEGWRVEVAGTGANYPATYLCMNGTREVSFTNVGTRPVTLVHAEITYDAGSPDEEQFSFDDGTRLKQVDRTLMQGESLTFTVRYNPTTIGNARAIIIYTWETTDGSSTVIQPLFGTGKFIYDTVTVTPVAGGDVYSVETNDFFEVPIRIAQDIPADANIRGYRMKIAYRQDLLKLIDVRDESGFDVTVSEISGRGDGAGALDTIEVSATGDLTDQDLLATLNFQLMVARDSSTTIDILDAQLLDAEGTAVCYAALQRIPANFVPQDICGDKVLRSALNNRLMIREIRIGPNPAHDVVDLDFELASESSVSMEVFDVLGQQAMAPAEFVDLPAGRNRRQIDVSQLPSGTYYLRIYSSHGTSSHAITVRR